MGAYTPRLQRAMQFAATRHAGATRKVTEAPFITHPLAAALVLADAGVTDEDVLVAAVLHDVVEDEPVGRSEIEALFGLRVGDLVCEMTESTEDDAGGPLDWGGRKARIVETARTTGDPDLLALKAADLICNATDLIGEHERLGEAVLERFGPQGGTRQVGYYLDLARILDERPLPAALASQVRKVIRSLEELAGETAEVLPAQ
jgi:(p)ppGpp synthase/HD superfamily hydrolase